MEVKSLEVIADERLGEDGGWLRIRRMKLRLVRADGTKTKEGTWDFVERPKGLDAVVLALWRRGAQGVEVLLRSGVRVPLQFGRPTPPALLVPELVAGIVEAGEHDLQKRASDEALEEAGLRVEEFERLGPPSFPTPGMCAELFNYFSAEVTGQQAGKPEGDGSPFEEGAKLEWVLLDEALNRCARGEIPDMKTELGLRRLRERVR